MSDVDGKGGAEELAEEGNDVDTREPASRERESGEVAAAGRETTVRVLRSLGAARFKHSPA